MKLIIVTGLSGAGKSQALHALEDMGYYCVDNLPPLLIPNMVSLCLERADQLSRVALGIDTRSGAFFGDMDKVLDMLGAMGITYDILYLDATDEELIRRYKETRRAHPMGSESMLIQNINVERQMLRLMQARATRVLDTTTMLTRQLRESLLRMYGEVAFEKAISINILSFGFKHGLPQDADLVYDVRFIPNPFYVPEMRALTGMDATVRDYVLSFPESETFLEKTLDMLKFLIPLYIREGKDRLVVGVGCTGGQHRSVALCVQLGEGLRAADFRVSITHRDQPGLGGMRCVL